MERNFVFVGGVVNEELELDIVPEQLVDLLFLKQDQLPLSLH